jgi:hypothetical protein
MYLLKFIHSKGTSTLSWDLESHDDTEENVVFTECDGKMAAGFRFNACPELLTISSSSSDAPLLELCFLPARMLYMLRLYDDRRRVSREFYLEEDELETDQQFTVRY